MSHDACTFHSGALKFQSFKGYVARRLVGYTDTCQQKCYTQHTTGTHTREYAYSHALLQGALNLGVPNFQSFKAI